MVEPDTLGEGNRPAFANRDTIDGPQMDQQPRLAASVGMQDDLHFDAFDQADARIESAANADVLAQQQDMSATAPDNANTSSDATRAGALSMPPESKEETTGFPGPALEPEPASGSLLQGEQPQLEPGLVNAEKRAEPAGEVAGAWQPAPDAPAEVTEAVAAGEGEHAAVDLARPTAGAQAAASGEGFAAFGAGTDQDDQRIRWSPSGAAAAALGLPYQLVASELVFSEGGGAFEEPAFAGSAAAAADMASIPKEPVEAAAHGGEPAAADELPSWLQPRDSAKEADSPTGTCARDKQLAEDPFDSVRVQEVSAGGGPNAATAAVATGAAQAEQEEKAARPPSPLQQQRQPAPARASSASSEDLDALLGAIQREEEEEEEEAERRREEVGAAELPPPPAPRLAPISPVFSRRQVEEMRITSSPTETKVEGEPAGATDAAPDAGEATVIPELQLPPQLQTGPEPAAGPGGRTVSYEHAASVAVAGAAAAAGGGAEALEGSGAGAAAGSGSYFDGSASPGAAEEPDGRIAEREAEVDLEEVEAASGGDVDPVTAAGERPEAREGPTEGDGPSAGLPAGVQQHGDDIDGGGLPESGCGVETEAHAAAAAPAVGAQQPEEEGSNEEWPPQQQQQLPEPVLGPDAPAASEIDAMTSGLRQEDKEEVEQEKAEQAAVHLHSVPSLPAEAPAPAPPDLGALGAEAAAEPGVGEAGGELGKPELVGRAASCSGSGYGCDAPPSEGATAPEPEPGRAPAVAAEAAEASEPRSGSEPYQRRTDSWVSERQQGDAAAAAVTAPAAVVGTGEMDDSHHAFVKLAAAADGAAKEGVNRSVSRGSSGRRASRGSDAEHHSAMQQPYSGGAASDAGAGGAGAVCQDAAYGKDADEDAYGNYDVGDTAGTAEPMELVTEADRAPESARSTANRQPSRSGSGSCRATASRASSSASKPPAPPPPLQHLASSISSAAALSADGDVHLGATAVVIDYTGAGAYAGEALEGEDPIAADRVNTTIKQPQPQTQTQQPMQPRPPSSAPSSPGSEDRAPARSRHRDHAGSGSDNGGSSPPPPPPVSSASASPLAPPPPPPPPHPKQSRHPQQHRAQDRRQHHQLEAQQQQQQHPPHHKQVVPAEQIKGEPRAAARMAAAAKDKASSEPAQRQSQHHNPQPQPPNPKLLQQQPQAKHAPPQRSAQAAPPAQAVVRGTGGSGVRGEDGGRASRPAQPWGVLAASESADPESITQQYLKLLRGGQLNRPNTAPGEAAAQPDSEARSAAGSGTAAVLALSAPAGTSGGGGGGAGQRPGTGLSGASGGSRSSGVTAQGMELARLQARTAWEVSPLSRSPRPSSRPSSLDWQGAAAGSGGGGSDGRLPPLSAGGNGNGGSGAVSPSDRRGGANRGGASGLSPESRSFKMAQAIRQIESDHDHGGGPPRSFHPHPTISAAPYQKMYTPGPGSYSPTVHRRGDSDILGGGSFGGGSPPRAWAFGSARQRPPHVCLVFPDVSPGPVYLPSKEGLSTYPGPVNQKFDHDLPGARFSLTAGAPPNAPLFNPGPGSYQPATTAAGDSLSPGRSGTMPAYSFAHTRKLMGPATDGAALPVISREHAREYHGTLSPGPARYSPDTSPTRPAAPSYSVAGRQPCWFDPVELSPGPVYKPNEIDRRGVHSLGDMPHATIGKGPKFYDPNGALSSSAWLSLNHARRANYGVYSPGPMYLPNDPRVPHVPSLLLATGPMDRFNARNEPGRLQ